MINRIYIDTSVFGGYFDTEFNDATGKFFRILNEQNVTILVSEILELEIYKAPDNIVELFESLKNTEGVERVRMPSNAAQI